MARVRGIDAAGPCPPEDCWNCWVCCCGGAGCPGGGGGGPAGDLYVELSVLPTADDDRVLDPQRVGLRQLDLAPLAQERGDVVEHATGVGDERVAL